MRYRTVTFRLDNDKRRKLFNKISNGWKQDLPTWGRTTAAWTEPLKSFTSLLEIKSASAVATTNKHLVKEFFKEHPCLSHLTSFHQHSPSVQWALQGAAAHRGAAQFGPPGGSPLWSEAVAVVVVQAQLMMASPRGILWWARLEESHSVQTMDPWNPCRLNAFTEEKQ